MDPMKRTSTNSDQMTVPEKKQAKEAIQLPLLIPTEVAIVMCRMLSLRDHFARFAAVSKACRAIAYDMSSLPEELVLVRKGQLTALSKIVENASGAVNHVHSLCYRWNVDLTQEAARWLAKFHECRNVRLEFEAAYNSTRSIDARVFSRLPPTVRNLTVIENVWLSTDRKDQGSDAETKEAGEGKNEFNLPDLESLDISGGQSLARFAATGGDVPSLKTVRVRSIPRYLSNESKNRSDHVRGLLSKAPNLETLLFDDDREVDPLPLASLCPKLRAIRSHGPLGQIAAETLPELKLLVTPTSIARHVSKLGATTQCLDHVILFYAESSDELSPTVKTWFSRTKQLTFATKSDRWGGESGSMAASLAFDHKTGAIVQCQIEDVKALLATFRHD